MDGVRIEQKLRFGRKISLWLLGEPWRRDYLARKVILALVRSYGDSSTVTASPGTIRMKCLRIFPDTCARTVFPAVSLTRNMVPGSTSVTVPSASIDSSLAMVNW